MPGRDKIASGRLSALVRARFIWWVGEDALSALRFKEAMAKKQDCNLEDPRPQKATDCECYEGCVSTFSPAFSYSGSLRDRCCSVDGHGRPCSKLAMTFYRLVPQRSKTRMKRP